MKNATGAMGYVLQSDVIIHTGNHETDGQQRSLRSWFGKSPGWSEADISGIKNHVQQKNLETSKETSNTKKLRGPDEDLRSGTRVRDWKLLTLEWRSNLRKKK